MPCAPLREWTTGSCGAIDALPLPEGDVPPARGGRPRRQPVSVRRSAARPPDVGLELFEGQRAILVDIGGLEILEQGVHFLLQRQPSITLHVGGLERSRTGFWQLIGGQVALV